MAGRSAAVLASLGAALLCGATEAAAAPTCFALARLQPRDGWSELDSNNCELCMFNQIRIGPGSDLRWNDTPIGDSKLRIYLGRIRAMIPQPVTLIRIDPRADCATIDRISRMVERETPCPRGSFCRYGLDKRMPARRRLGR
jgi:hypothetical protein